MRFEQLRPKIKNYPIFTTQDVLKWSPPENPQTLRLQLSGWVKKDYLKKLKKDLFWFSETELGDNFYLADRLLTPSYISLETALNYYGIIPDVPFTVTCVTSLLTRVFDTPFGRYQYRHVKQENFFGWHTIYGDDRKFYYHIATPEKALLDFIYFNLSRLSKLSNLAEERFNFDQDFSWLTFMRLSRRFKNLKFQGQIQRIRDYYK